ncbi:hypothetical protein HanOQP8_Chr08g0280291 [Helianthus annuus]|nr:hypothetical protein HanOQP8_Chr08g0280291 [Helianthus annuus]
MNMIMKESYPPRSAGFFTSYIQFASLLVNSIQTAQIYVVIYSNATIHMPCITFALVHVSSHYFYSGVHVSSHFYSGNCRSKPQIHGRAMVSSQAWMADLNIRTPI